MYMYDYLGKHNVDLNWVRRVASCVILTWWSPVRAASLYSCVRMSMVSLLLLIFQQQFHRYNFRLLHLVDWLYRWNKFFQIMKAGEHLDQEFHDELDCMLLQHSSVTLTWWNILNGN